MIDIRELRVGCYLLFDDIIGKVESISNHGGTSEYEIDSSYRNTDEDLISLNSCVDDFNPIPLTEDVLLKCGFLKYEDFEPGEQDYLELWRRDIIYYIPDEFGSRRGFNAGYVNPTELRFSLVIDGYENKFKAKYLHQLQNIYFALTGNELEINL